MIDPGPDEWTRIDGAWLYGREGESWMAKARTTLRDRLAMPPAGYRPRIRVKARSYRTVRLVYVDTIADTEATSPWPPDGLMAQLRAISASLPKQSGAPLVTTTEWPDMPGFLRRKP